MKKVLKTGFFKRRGAPKKLKGNMIITIIIFMLSFLVFCICAIDAGHVVVSRFKVQKVTETLALYMASYLNSKPVDERTKDTLEPLKERFEDLYSSTLSGYYNFKITDIELKSETTSPKIKISTEANIPTLFLKYAGIGIIKIMQVSYAKAETADMTLVDPDTNSFTYEASDIITDKKGNDIKVRYGGDYFIFAGLKGSEGEIFWSDVSFAAKDKVKKKFEIPLGLDGTYELGCISKSADFDFSKDEKTIGLVRYIKIYKADCAKDLTPPEEGSEGTGGVEGGSSGVGEGGGVEEAPVEGEGGTPAIGGDGSAEEGSLGETPAEGGAEEGGTEGSEGPAEGTGSDDDTVTTPEIKILNSVKLIRNSEF